MSSNDPDELLTGRPGLNADAGYTVMDPDPRVPKEPDDNTTYDDVDHAFDEVQKARGKVEREPLVEREYRNIADGSKTEPNKTLDIDRAASDLARQRAEEVAEIEAAENRQLADAVDSAHGRATETEAAEWVAQQQAQQQPQQPQTEPPPPGVDAELYELLRNNPKVSAALQAEVAQVTRAQQSFADASLQNAKLAAAALVADVPELQGVDLSQYGLRASAYRAIQPS